MSSDDQDKESELNPRIYLLELFQEFINPSEGGEIDLTLNVHRTLVSGTMIGMKQYYEKLGQSFMKNLNVYGTKDGGIEAKKTLQDMFDKIKQPPTEEDLKKRVLFNHIFLKDVQIYTGSGKVKAPLWIGRIASVDGFVLGELLSYP